MSQTLPEGAFIVDADVKRIEAAYHDLLATKTAHGSFLVRIGLHVHHEYPKHVQVGEKTVVVNSAEEHAALIAPPEPPELVADPSSDADVAPVVSDTLPATPAATEPPDAPSSGPVAVPDLAPSAPGAFDDSPADTPEEVAEEAEQEAQDAVDEAAAESHPAHRKRRAAR